ncbi:MAG: L,D-transpeptidase family protein, partial [Methylomonas sp.]|nr:L,D-transpeptidase family protein [Methylomonas sp.]
ARLDTALSLSLIRFINDIHYGRVKPRQLNYPSPFGSKQSLDAASLIKQSLDNQALAQVPEIAAPQFKQYRQLKQVLAQYRQALPRADFQPLIFEKSLRPGDRHPQTSLLRDRLIAAGALPAQQPEQVANEENLYSETLQEGVKAFQRQNGLQADGVIGTETAARLNQSPEQKILQIELAMERLRWLPEDLSGPLIIVNIPAYELWAFDRLDDSQPLNMKVIVGKALKNQTPVLFEEMKYLEFKPYWNIPRNIMNEEILPRLTNDWGYLESQNMELVGNSESWEDIFDDIRRGKIRARQRPGKKNPLGKVKFIFPNQADVYLHDTSTPGLFNRSRRDFSHGCVRVEAAEKLAEFVLNHQPESGWDLSAIQKAMQASQTRRVTLTKAIPVLFYYATAFVDHNDNIHFYPDIYEQDAALKKALGIWPMPANNGVLTARSSGSS